MTELHYEEQLRKIFSNVNDWLKFAETKNFGLLTFNAAIVFGISRISFGDSNIFKISTLYIFSSLAVISSLFCLLSLFPILTKIEKGNSIKGIIKNLSKFIDKENHFENIHFYGYLKGLNTDQFIQKFKEKTSSEKEFTEYEKELVVQILYSSRITWLKYQLFKIGAFFTLIGIILGIISLPVLKFILK